MGISSSCLSRTGSNGSKMAASIGFFCTIKCPFFKSIFLMAFYFDEKSTMTSTLLSSIFVKGVGNKGMEHQFCHFLFYLFFCA